MRVRACARECVCVCVLGGGWVSGCVHVYVCGGMSGGGFEGLYRGGCASKEGGGVCVNNVWVWVGNS